MSLAMPEQIEIKSKCNRAHQSQSRKQSHYRHIGVKVPRPTSHAPFFPRLTLTHVAHIFNPRPLKNNIVPRYL